MEIKKRYNLFTAIAMVVGIVIGSGVFFKAPSILAATNGNLGLSLLAWFIGGLVMMISAYTISLIASNCKRSNNLADMAEETVGRKHSFIMSWYYAVAYYPLLVGILGWVCADFTFVLFGHQATVAQLAVLSFVYVAIMYIVNILAPKIAGYLQISTTTIKLIPLVIMALFGIGYGLISNDGHLLENFASGSVYSGGKGFMAALCATCFAYEGWVVATSISKEVDNPKKTLPKALLIGTSIVLIVYLLFFTGLAGTFTNLDFINNGNEQIKASFSIIFGNIGGTLLYVFVVISCLGTLNGLCMGSSRALKQIAEKNNGPSPKTFITINKNDMNLPSAFIGLALSFIWLGIWLVMYYNGLTKGASWAIDISELIIVFVYMAYIPMYISIIKNRTDLNTFNRYVMPGFAIAAALLLISAGIYSHGMGTLVFLCVVGAILFVGMLFYKEDNSPVLTSKKEPKKAEVKTTAFEEVKYEPEADLVLMEDSSVVLREVE